MGAMMKREASELLQKITINDELLEKFYLKEPIGKTGGSRGRNILKKFSKERRSRSVSSIQSFPSLLDSAMSSRPSLTDERDFSEDLNIRRILILLTEKADFLVDEDLIQLMNCLEDKERLLLKVDSIMTNLGVEDTTELERIMEHISKLSGLHEDKRNSGLISAKKRSKVSNWPFWICIFTPCEVAQSHP